MNWFALSVKSHHETAVSARLINKGFEVFLPLYRTTRTWSDRKKEIQLPLFDGYVFCRFNPNERSVPVATTPGVFRIVSMGNTPAPVPDHEIEAVRAVTNSRSVVEPWPYIPKGSPVQITSGVLSGVEGSFMEEHTGGRLIVSITLLQRSVAVQIDRTSVRPQMPYTSALSA